MSDDRTIPATASDTLPHADSNEHRQGRDEVQSSEEEVVFSDNTRITDSVIAIGVTPDAA